MAKYKEGDYIIITGQCDKEYLNKSARIHLIYDDCYLIDMLGLNSYHIPWKQVIADANSKLNEHMCVLYGKN